MERENALTLSSEEKNELIRSNKKVKDNHHNTPERTGIETQAIDNSLILHIFIIIRKYYHTYFELTHAFYSWFWNNAK